MKHLSMLLLLLFFVADVSAQQGAATSGPIELVAVRGGTFMMGSNDGDSDEKPVHTVSVNSFMIGKYEVTQKQWRDIMGTSPSYKKNCDDCPVEQVSWDDVQGFLVKLNDRYPGHNYRLPTEAEWEFAARGGNSSKGYKYSGNNNIDRVANTGTGTLAVGSKDPNELGIYDMSGNIWEWCSDGYGAYPSGMQTDPYLSTGDRRVLRGGGWSFGAAHCRVALRLSSAPGFRIYDIGFRVVASR